jgi:ribosomal protein S18 acetylase RimI-like enzyme
VASQVPFRFDIARFDLGSPHIDDVVSVYSSVFLSHTDRSRQLVLDAMQRKEFFGRVAFVDGIAVAMAYGAASEVGHWWYDTIAEALGPDHPALQSSWNLMELAVLSSFRRRGLATALVDDLLFAQPYPRALLSVIVHNAPARTFYENGGWRYLHSDLTFTATPNRRYAIMGRELR